MFGNDLTHRAAPLSFFLNSCRQRTQEGKWFNVAVFPSQAGTGTFGLSIAENAYGAPANIVFQLSEEEAEAEAAVDSVGVNVVGVCDRVLRDVKGRDAVLAGASPSCIGPLKPVNENLSAKFLAVVCRRNTTSSSSSSCGAVGFSLRGLPRFLGREGPAIPC